MPLPEAGRHAGPTPGLLFALALLAALVAGMQSLIRVGLVAAQSIEAPLPTVPTGSALTPVAQLPAALSSAAPPDGMHDDLPPSIRKARPSGSVQADMPGRTQRDCTILRAVQVYQGIGRRTEVAVSPADLPGVTPGGPCPPEQ